MSRNKLAGTTKGTSRSARYYQNNPEARAKKDAYNTKFHSTPERRRYRSLLIKKNREAGSKVGDGKDYDHAVGKFVSQKVNRGRTSKSGRSTPGDRSARS